MTRGRAAWYARRNASGKVASVDTRRLVPRTDVLLADPRLAEAERKLGRALVKAAVARAQDQARAGTIAPDGVADAAVAALPARAATLTPVINATGVLLHTNLGRAPLSGAATDALARRGRLHRRGVRPGQRDPRAPGPGDAGGPGRRGAGRRERARGQQQRRRAGAGRDRAGRRARDPDQPRRDGRDRRRVPAARPAASRPGRGCARSARPTGRRSPTTRPRPARHTAFALKVHPSNFRIEGFTAQAGVRELARALGPAVPVVADIGSGLLAPHPRLPGRARRADGAAGRGGAGHRERRQAARRPPGRPAARPGGPGPDARPASAGPRAAGRQADPGRPGGDPGRAAHAGRAGAGRRPRRAGPAGRADRGGPAHARDRRPRGGDRTARSAAAAPPAWRCPAPP